MSNKSEKMGPLRQFRRDIYAIASLFFVIILGLWVFGALNGSQALTSVLLGVTGSAVYYSSRSDRIRRDIAHEEANRIADVPIASIPKASIEVEQAFLEALNRPALLLSDNHIQSSNDAAIRLFNLPEDPSDLSIASLRDPTLLGAIDQVLAKGGHAACEIQPARNLGEYWLADVTALGEDPARDGMLLVMTDQKPIRMAQQARADFLANASHELRTPLTSIAGFIETMKGPAKDDMGAWPRFIDIMDEQTRHMRDLIGDLLSLSRIELSGHLLPNTELDLGLTAEQTLEALHHVAAVRGLKLTLERPEAPLTILGDEGEVKQVIRNLIGNAMKYAPDDSAITATLGVSPSLNEAQTEATRTWDQAGRVTLLSPQARPGPAIWMRIKDTGHGIAPEHLPRLGERFFRIDDSRGGPIEGTGLGLAIVKHIMARHQGGFAVESLSDAGASFSIWFSARDA